MARFTQEVLQEGSFDAGGVAVSFTKDDLKEIALSSKQLLESGNAIPLLFEHAEAGSKEGAPRTAHDRKADQVRNGAGWVEDVRVNDKGRLEVEFEATDPTAAEGLKNKSIRFTSPELRKAFNDGQGREFRNIVSHLALTHKPRNVGQGPIKALQFSLDAKVAKAKGAQPWSTLQMADDNNDGKPDETEGEKPNAPPAPEENPDLPKKVGPSDDAKQITAILEHLKVLGVGLPADTDESNFKDRLLTALLTKEAGKAEKEAEEAKEAAKGDKGAGDPLVEQQPQMMQFSLADADAPETKVSKLQRNAAKTHVELLEAKAKGTKGYTPAMHSRLFAPKALQFSADAELVQTFTLDEVVDILADTLPGAVAALQLSAGEADEGKHPGGEAFTHAGKDGAQPESPEHVQEVVDWALGRKKAG